MVDRKAVLNLYSQGFTYSHIGSLLGISRQRVWQIVKRHFPSEALKRSGKRTANVGFHSTKSEKYLLGKLTYMGFTAIPQTYNAPFDFLINGYTVEAKHSSKPDKMVKTSYFRFQHNYTLLPVDFYIFMCGKLGREICYILPREIVTPTVNIPVEPRYRKNIEKWNKYKENWDLLERDSTTNKIPLDNSK